MADAAAAVMDAPWERVIPDAALVEGARKCARLASGRGIMLLRVEGTVHCMDHACYHHGAPLLHADIEDLGDHKCIVCPWHNYKIDLATGEGVYVGLDSDALAAGRKEGSIKSKGIKQRVHPTQVSAASPDAAEDAPAPADPTPYIWVRESAPSDVRAIITARGPEVPVAPVAPAAATSASVAAALSTVHEPAGPERIKGTKKPRRKDPPAGWMASDDYAYLPF